MSAFEGCKGLREITIPRSVSVIERDAFGNCTELTVYVEGKPAPVEGWSVYWIDQSATVVWEGEDA